MESQRKGLRDFGIDRTVRIMRYYDLFALVFPALEIRTAMGRFGDLFYRDPRCTAAAFVFGFWKLREGTDIAVEIDRKSNPPAAPLRESS